MAFYPSIPTYSWDQLVHEWRQHEPEQSESDDGYLDDVALALRQHGAKGITFLRSQLSQPDGIRVSAAILGLSHPAVTDPAITNTFVDLLTDGRPRVRAAAVRGLAASGRRDVLAQIVLLVRDTSGLVRRSALEFIRQFDPEHAKERLVSALGDLDDLVRMCGWPPKPPSRIFQGWQSPPLVQARPTEIRSTLPPTLIAIPVESPS